MRQKVRMVGPPTRVWRRFANRPPETDLFRSLFVKRDHKHDYRQWGKRVKKQKAGAMGICNKKCPWIHESPCACTRSSEVEALLVLPKPGSTPSTSARLSTLTYLHNLLETNIDAVDKIINGDIVHYVYDVAAQRLVRRDLRVRPANHHAR